MDKFHKHNSINTNTPLSESYRSDSSCFKRLDSRIVITQEKSIRFCLTGEKFRVFKSSLRWRFKSWSSGSWRRVVLW